MTYRLVHSAVVAAVLSLAPCAGAATLDGANIPSEGLTLRATQDTPGGFGDATGGGQDSTGGSELNELYADIDGRFLTIGMTGNLEGNFNKMFVFLDAVAGGESTLASDNADGGFGEINNMSGLMFDGGATMDHGLRFEVGGGFNGVNFFDLIDNSASSVTSGGGPGSLPVANAGTSAITVGWDNSNILGVDGGSAAGAATATTGWEIQIDMIQAFGATQGDVNIAAIVTSGDASFLSNQALPGVGGAGNLGPADGNTLLVATVQGEPIPEPTTLAIAGLAGLMLAARRR